MCVLFLITIRNGLNSTLGLENTSASSSTYNIQLDKNNLITIYADFVQMGRRNLLIRSLSYTIMKTEFI